jgi:hypothetical protein
MRDLLKTFSRITFIIFPCALLGFLIGKGYNLYFLDTVLATLMGMYISSLETKKNF